MSPSRRSQTLSWLLGAAVLGASVAASPAAAGSSTSQPKTVAETVIDLVGEAWREDPALVAMRARDKGYDLTETLDAMSDGDLASDGTITDEGRPVVPAGPPTGVLARVGEDEVSEALARNQRTVTKPKVVDPPAEYLDNGAFDLVLILALMAEGYTLEQIIVDGIMANGVRPAGPFGRVVIVDEDDEVVRPDLAPVEDASVEGIIRDMTALVQGGNPLDPEFKRSYKATYKASFGRALSGATLTATGWVGPSAGGDCCLGQVRGTLKVPASEKCAAETVPITIGLNGFQEGKGPAELYQTWAVSGTPTGGGGSGICITAAKAPELVGAVGSLVGPLRGAVGDGKVLVADPETTLGLSAELRLAKK